MAAVYSLGNSYGNIHALRQAQAAAIQSQIGQSRTQQQHQQSRRPASKQRFYADLSQCLYDFVVQLLPTQEELSVKEDVRKLLERLIKTIEPDSRLLSFGSTANGFSLRNSDMDLCCLIDSEERLAAADLVTMLGDLLERETKFHVKPLPHARIPIVKLSLDPSPGLPFGIACDIGFENRLALENTRLLMCYAMIDAPRVRTLVLFLKVWCKRRKINSPYKGTLSSYGYVLLVIYFLVHVKNPPVLPNLQQMPPLRSISPEETYLSGYNTWFFDDINLLRERWQSSNTESVAELLIDFFRFYSREFTYNTGVVSIRAGLLKKDSKGWHHDPEIGSSRERNRLCIEDPFETDFNVARCVTKDGLYIIRGEFMRASRVLASRPERAILTLAQLCEERKEELQASPSRMGAYIPPRLSSLPPQTPYTVGSSPMRPTGAPIPDRLSPPEVHESSPIIPRTADSSKLPANQLQQLEHMAPKRSKWTSPPPPDAPEADRSAFEDRLGHGLVLATSSADAREIEHDNASSTNSEVHTDDEDQMSIPESDDVRSIRSYTEERTPYAHRSLGAMQAQQAQQYTHQEPPTSLLRLQQMQTEGGWVDPKWLALAKLRGRSSVKGSPTPLTAEIPPSPLSLSPRCTNEPLTPPPRLDTPRRSLSGPSRTPNRFSMTALPTVVTPVSVYPRTHTLQQQAQPHSQSPSPLLRTTALATAAANTNVYYETSPSPVREQLPRAMVMNGAFAMPIARLPQYGSPRLTDSTPYQVASSSGGASPVSPYSYPRHHVDYREDIRTANESTSTTPLQANELQTRARLHSHSHSHSQATVIAPTPPPNSSRLADDAWNTIDRNENESGSKLRSGSTPSSPPISEELPYEIQAYDIPKTARLRCTSPHASVSSASGSPAMSYVSSQYAASTSPVSTSPPSPSDLLDPLPKPDSKPEHLSAIAVMEEGNPGSVSTANFILTSVGGEESMKAATLADMRTGAGSCLKEDIDEELLASMGTLSFDREHRRSAD